MISNGKTGKICIEFGGYLVLIAAGILAVSFIIDIILTCLLFNKWKIHRPIVVKNR